MLLPNCGPLPQISHTCAIVQLQIFECFTEAGTRRDAVRTTSPEACRISSIQRMRAQRQGLEPAGSGQRTVNSEQLELQISSAAAHGTRGTVEYRIALVFGPLKVRL